VRDVALLRFFAFARDAAGVGRADIDGRTVGEVLDKAVVQFGPSFAEVLATSKVWCNGEPTDRDRVIGATDEVAILPPVSGG